MTETTKDLSKIAIRDVEMGMYVVSVVNPRTQLSVKSEGFVSSAKTLEKLKKSGVKFIFIDMAKSKHASKPAEQPEPENSIEPEPAKETVDHHKRKVPLDAEMNKAVKLYNNAKDLQGKILTSITDSKEIDIAEVSQTTDAIVDSIFRNQDALSCMSRIRMKDEYLVEHSLNVAVLISIFAKHMSYDKQTIEQLALGAFLHDIGKVLIPDEVLNKPGKLTSDEYELMKGHVIKGLEVVKTMDGVPDIALSLIATHHERLDGKGYPYGLNAEDISIFDRMIAIVDSYDAMTADRVYKAGMHPIQAFKNLIKDSIHSYDNGLVEKFIQSLGLYPVGTLVKLTSGKVGLISGLNKNKPLQPIVKVFYNTRLKQNIAIEEIDLMKPKYDDQIDCCVRPEEFNLNLLNFFRQAFMN
ncbi:HD-GYP domain-containing protein [Thalassotalea sp. LPB0316]|uniref:HD-GYP domain-containing protein n=1 Tax=Thalassotalea sp. LPB0316 TaxID=2769490 RepID=UPI0018667C4A|nr:HD-GYP domain-containing protein [Thalassotalea sp. LPB0316]QOL26912.1 HD-GYP domain-containing protein [Thalassotalea sp. LPB0316]